MQYRTNIANGLDLYFVLILVRKNHPYKLPFGSITNLTSPQTDARNARRFR